MMVAIKLELDLLRKDIHCTYTLWKARK